MGCDFSGTVVRAGKNVVNPAVGAHVAGFVHGGTFADEGAFAEYVKVPAELVWTVPEGTLSHEEAATLGCAWVVFLDLAIGFGADERPERIGFGLRYRHYTTRRASRSRSRR